MYSEKQIPKEVTALKEFKTWRIVGSKREGAVMMGLIEFLINKRSSKLDKEIIETFKSGIPNLKVIQLLKNTQALEPNKRIKYIYEQLGIQDTQDQYSSELATQYLQKKGQKSEGAIKFFSEKFSVAIQMNNDPGQNIQGDPEKSDGVLIFYKYHNNYHFIMKILEKCSICNEKVQLQRLKCNHFICMICLTKYFGEKKTSKLQCQEMGCAYPITKEFYEQLISNLQPITNNKQQQSQNDNVSKTFCSKCQKSKNKEDMYILLCKHILCQQCVSEQIEQSKSISEYCLISQCQQGKFRPEDFQSIRKSHFVFQTAKENQQSQLNQKKESQKIESTNQKKESCQNEQKEQQFQREQSSIKEVQSEKQENPKSRIQNDNSQQSSDDSQNVAPTTVQQQQKQESKAIQLDESTKKELDSLPLRKCIKCGSKGHQSMYKARCNHYYCEKCYTSYNQYDKFHCDSYDCREILRQYQLEYISCEDGIVSNQVEDKSSQQYTKQYCCKCQTKYITSELFYSLCHHYICLKCIQYLANNYSIKCPQCRRSINENMVEDYYLEQQTQLIKKQSEEESQIQQAPELDFKNFNDQMTESEKYHRQPQLNECSFCHSPFSDYNCQQDIICSNHIIGVCCIIFPLDCPQCQLNSLKIHQSRLKFQLPEEEPQEQPQEQY